MKNSSRPPYEVFGDEPSKHKHIVRIIWLTPDIAGKFLDTRPENQRSIRRFQVERIIRDIKAGRWRLNGETIVFDSQGRLVQGQHRCQAVIESGVPIQVYVIWGVDSDISSSYDNTSRRTAADGLKADGFSNTWSLGCAARRVMSYESRRSGVPLASPASEIVEFCKANPDLSESVRMCRASEKLAKSIETTVLAAMHFLFSKRSRSQADEFIEKLISGENLTSGSPILALRNCMIRVDTKFDATDSMILIIKCWNAYRQDKKITRLNSPGRNGNREDMPEIL